MHNFQETILETCPVSGEDLLDSVQANVYYPNRRYRKAGVGLKGRGNLMLWALQLT